MYYEGLSDKELLRILVAEKPGEGVSEKLMTVFTSLPYILVDSTEEELLKVRGVGRGRASQLKACCELARRLYTQKLNQSQVVKSPDDVSQLFMSEMKFLRREQFRIVILNTKNYILEVKVISEGNLNSSIVHPREVFSLAVKRSAAAIICAHNHPSGDPEPSCEDIETTKRLVEAGNVLGVKVLDHVVIGDGRYVSLKERGLI